VLDGVGYDKSLEFMFMSFLNSHWLELLINRVFFLVEQEN
jgi:hypothetical protein